MRARAAGVEPPESTAPDRAPLVLLALILVAGVANLNLSVANVALPSIGQEFEATQTALDLVAVGYSLGLAASVLYLSTIGDRYGRKLLLVLGMAVSVPACLLAGLAPSIEVLVLARLLGGVAAGVAFPTTLALITALWSGPARTRSIALWSALGGALSAFGPVSSGWVRTHFYWGSVFLITPAAGGAGVGGGRRAGPQSTRRPPRSTTSAACSSSCSASSSSRTSWVTRR